MAPWVWIGEDDPDTDWWLGVTLQVLEARADAREDG